jgi:hypothetical protein
MRDDFDWMNRIDRMDLQILLILSIQSNPPCLDELKPIVGGLGLSAD